MPMRAVTAKGGVYATITLHGPLHFAAPAQVPFKQHGRAPITPYTEAHYVLLAIKCSSGKRATTLQLLHEPLAIHIVDIALA